MGRSKYAPIEATIATRYNIPKIKRASRGRYGGLLEQFRLCFLRPQFKNFSTYILGLVACGDRRSVDAINRMLRGRG